MKHIIPNVGIDRFLLGQSKEELFQIIDESNFFVEYRTGIMVLTYQNYKIWINVETEKITQVLVFESYEGKFQNLIGIGDTLTDVKELIGQYYFEDSIYKLKNHLGICFELKDSEINEDWNEDKAPIEFISVFKEE